MLLKRKLLFRLILFFDQQDCSKNVRKKAIISSTLKMADFDHGSTLFPTSISLYGYKFEHFFAAWNAFTRDQPQI